MALVHHRRASFASSQLPPARLYLEDVSELVAYLEKQVGPVSIYIGDVEAEKVDDLLEVGTESTRKLRLVANAPGRPDLRVTVEFDVLYARVDVASGEPVAHGMVHGIHKIVHGRRRRIIAPLRTLAEAIPWWAVLFLPFLAFVVFDEFSALVWILIFFPLLVSLPFLSNTVIVLRYRSKSPSFWKRKGDDIVAALVVGVILGVLGFFAGMAVERGREEQNTSPQDMQSSPASTSDMQSGTPR